MSKPESLLSVYRVETPEGLGPWRASSPSPTHAGQMPTTSSDGISKWIKDGRHGFHDPADVCHYFGPDVPLLKKHGFVIREYEVPMKHARFGKTTSQTLYDNRHAALVREYPVTVAKKGIKAFEPAKHPLKPIRNPAQLEAF